MIYTSDVPRVAGPRHGGAALRAVQGLLPERLGPDGARPGGAHAQHL